MATQPIHKVDHDILPGKRHPGRRLTEAQFEAWIDEDTRAEWVDGEIVMMSPANRDHSALAQFILAILQTYVQKKDLGDVFGTEYQVRMERPRRRRVPDVLFVTKTRREILTPTFVDGPPDLVMEVVSPDSDARDWREKFLDYQAGGVREYWVIDPMSENVEAYALKDRAYRQIMPRKGRITSTVVRGFWIKTDWLWMRPLPTILTTLRDLGIIK